MPATIATGDEYEKQFNIDGYMKDLYKNTDPSIVALSEFFMKNLYKAFSDGKIKGKQLDIGPGPTVNCIISSCNYVDEIYMADYSKRHIEILNKWKNGDIAIQEKQIEYVLSLENKGQSVADRVQQMRSKVKDICFIDVTKQGTLKGENVPNQFDVITSCWCLDSCGQPLDTYKECAKTISSYLKPGGYFILCGNLDSTEFTIAGDSFPIIKISEDEIRSIYESVGMNIISLTRENFVQKTFEGETLFSLTAQKKA